MKRIAQSVLIATIATAITGCSAMFDSAVSVETSLRNHILAQKAWGHWSWCYSELKAPYHFACGFKAGYRDVLNGGNGCQPTLPPQHYWKPHFQSPQGRYKIHAWFDGFSHGVLAASQDGYSSLGEIPISPTAQQNLELHNTPRPDDMFGPHASGHSDVGHPTPVDEALHSQQPTHNVDLVPALDGQPLPIPPVHNYE